LSEQLHPMAPHHLPFYIISPGETDVLMIVTGIILIAAVFAVGLLYWHLHSLPERMAHKTQKLQFEIVAVLGLIALFTHEHLYWIAALMLALIELPDFGTPLRSIAGSVEKIADSTAPNTTDAASQPGTAVAPASIDRNEQDVDADHKVRSHA
jgi:flagellar basal body-associated protein FliL